MATTEKAGILESFDLFIALRTGLAGEVIAGSDFGACGAVFLPKDADRWFLIIKSLRIDFREQLRTHQLTELVGKKSMLHGNTDSPSVERTRICRK